MCGAGSWADFYLERARSRRVLMAAGGKLAKPKLSMSYAHWKRDWEVEVAMSARISGKQRLAFERARADTAEGEARKLRKELSLAREVALKGEGKKGE